MVKNLVENLALYDEFLAYTGPDRLQKILARSELYKMALEVPGDVVECGVFKGSGIYTYAKLRHIFKPHSVQKILGFDFFDSERNAEIQHPADQNVLDQHATGWATQADILNNLKNMGITDVELIAGNVVETTKSYREQNLGFRISLLYLDVDNFEGTMGALENLYPLVANGGIVAFDEYAHRGHGEADAVDEFLKRENVKLKTLTWENTPTAYLVKGGN